VGGLFYDHFSIIDHITLNGRMIDELEGCDYGSVDGLSKHLPGGTEENHENLSQDSWCPARDSNPARPKYESRVLLLCHSTQFAAVQITWYFRTVESRGYA
jgi:hypothetical protein